MLQCTASVAGRFAMPGVVGMVIVFGSLLAGCGQKGPLTLPKALPAAPPASAASAP